MSTAQPNPKHTLLIVDDNQANRELLARVFGVHGFATTLAENGVQALLHIQSQPVDLVLLDIMMPVLNGMETLKRIREAPQTKHLPVILISAMASSDDVVRGLELGANDYIAKPIDPTVALARVSTQLALADLLSERNQTINDLRETQKMRERFFQIASHDLKGPLTNMRVAQVVLRELVGDNNRAQAILETMKATTESMQRVIEDFLETAALQSGVVDLKIECHSVRDIIWDTAVQHNMAAYDKHISIEIGKTDGTVLGDSTRLVQILGNFVSNAIKYSPQHTEINMWAEQADDGMRICVADQGPGIPEGERDSLFQAFGKLSTRPTGGESSTGLGLWIAQHLANLQNGQVGAAFPSDGGAVFWVAMPGCTK